MGSRKRARKPLDRTDRRILECLQDDGRMSNVALAKKVNLTPTPCLERVKRLERDGYIRGYSAILDPELVGSGLLVFVEIDLSRTSPAVFRDFRKQASRLSEVLECHLVSGNCSERKSCPCPASTDHAPTWSWKK